MADYSNYRDRKPSYGFGRNGATLQGFRSRPGAPMHDPTTNLPMSQNYPWTNWDSVFQPRMRGQPQEQPQQPDEVNMDAAFGGGNNQGMDLNAAFSGPNHQQMWSQPVKKPMFNGKLGNGWQSSSVNDRINLLGKYGSGNDAINVGFGWGSAFDNNAG